MVNLKNGNNINARTTEYGCISVLVLMGETKGKKIKKRKNINIPFLRNNEKLLK
jgi:hypothetical protein